MTKVYNVWAKKSTEELCLIALKIDAKFEGKLQKLKNRDFILECKMAELNKNKNSKQPVQPNAVWRLRNKWIAQLTKLFAHVLRNHCS